MSQRVAAEQNKQGSIEPLLHALGLFDQAANNLTEQSIERFSKRELAFDWIHMGNSRIQVGQLIEALRGTLNLLPPRTGHIGNWENMVQGCAGPRDYNNITCGEQGIGYPLLYDFNQTETDVPGVGDWSYLPGSIVKGGQRQPLELFTWDVRNFKRRERDEPLFTPFTVASIEGQLIPLCKLHRDRCGSLGNFDFHFLSTVLARKQHLARKVLRAFLEHARRMNTSEHFLKLIFDRSVGTDGKIARDVLEISGHGFKMGSRLYASIDDIIEHAMIPIIAAASPEGFIDSVSELPSQMPFPSIAIFHLLMAILHTHYPDISNVPPSMTRPCNPHVHWGGIPMAGSPPKTRGFFRGKSGDLRKLFPLVISEFREIDPVLYILLPAGIFNLCPHGAYPADVELSQELFDRVHRETDHLAHNPDEMAKRLERVAATWQATAIATLSSYFASRFSTCPNTMTALPNHAGSGLLLLPSFLTLSVQQTSMVLGALSPLNWQK